MASELSTLQFVLDQAGLGMRLTHKKMFGEYCLYLDDKVVAFLCDNQLFLKPTEEGRARLGTPTLAPPYPGAKDYFLIDEALDDPDTLRDLLETTARAVPPPKAKKPAAQKPSRSRPAN